MTTTTISILDSANTAKTVEVLTSSGGNATGPFIPIHAVSNSTGAVVDPATDESLQSIITVLNTSGIPTGANTIGGIFNVNPSTFVANRQATTTSAAALPSQTLVNGIVITALANNTGTVYVGPSSVSNTSGYPLAAGQSVSLGITNLSSVYILGINTTDHVAFIGN